MELKKFVQDACAGRDPSHGWEHMEKVMFTSLQIYKQEEKKHNWTSNDQKVVIYAASLHDVCDHKYEPIEELRKRMKTFLHKQLGNNDAIRVLNIIDRISYSKENKGLIDWGTLGKDLLLRNIVSDADKLEAIGKIGIIRCVQYIHEKNPTITPEDLVKKVEGHCHEKLFRLKDEFIRTEYGKKMAEPLHQELLDELDKLKRDPKRYAESVCGIKYAK